MRTTARAGLLAALLALAGCAGTTDVVMGDGTQVTATDTSRLTRTGFLTDYARLRPAPWGDGIECWRAPGADLKRFDAALVGRIVVSLKPGTTQSIDPSDLKTLTDYFHGALVNALKPVMPVTDKAGPGVIVIRVALTDLVPTTVTDSLAGTLVPYGFVAEAGSGVATGRPAGSTPYLGETGMEIQFRDGGSGAVLGECRDTQIGRKYAADLKGSTLDVAQTWASGYLNSFQAWSYAKDAFDRWARQLATRFAALRGQPAN